MFELQKEVTKTIIENTTETLGIIGFKSPLFMSVCLGDYKFLALSVVYFLVIFLY